MFAPPLSSRRKVNINTKLSAGVLAALLMTSPGAQASRVRSRYTTIEVKSCKALGQSQSVNVRSWMCPGLAGYPVYLAEKGHQQYISFGTGARNHRAAEQTLKPRNTIFESNARRPTIEWRFVRREGRDIPYAAIVRYSTTQNEAKGRALVVTKIAVGESCHVAYIDADANPDAIVLARNVADLEARAFDCKLEPRRMGAAAVYRF
jgi:hypothetical protein